MMSKETRKEYVREIKGGYLKAKRKEKTRMLDEAEEVTGYARNYLIRLLSAKTDLAKPARAGKRRGRRYQYPPRLIAKLSEVWELLDYPCGKRLQAALLEILPVLARCGELKLGKEDQRLLLSLSARTIDRRLKREKEVKKIGKKKGFATTKPGTLKGKIPIRRGYEWDEESIGFMEIDTVAHNGGDPSGLFVYTLNMTDIVSGWTESVACLGKSQYAVIETGLVGTVVPDLPFRLRGIDGDSGGEIINELLYRYCKKNKIVFTRSRPYHSNDGCHVEEKNWTHVRKIVGYGRMDTSESVRALSDLYRNELRLFLNFFQPHMRCVGKEFTGKRAKRTYEIMTPYRRLLMSDSVSKETKAELRMLYESLNPVSLKKSIESKLSRIGKLSKRNP